jgi:hypothetical protein
MQGNIDFPGALVAMTCVSAKHRHGIRATHLSIHDYRLELACIYICNACGHSDQPAVSSTDSGSGRMDCPRLSAVKPCAGPIKQIRTDWVTSCQFGPSSLHMSPFNASLLISVSYWDRGEFPIIGLYFERLMTDLDYSNDANSVGIASVSILIVPSTSLSSR